MDNGKFRNERQSINSSRPLVSAVIPTKGRPQLLRRALASVRAQTYANLETIVVVDGFDQEALAVVEEFSGCMELRYVVNRESLGAGEARNRGVREARGDWIAFLDDDDEWLAEKTEVQMSVALDSEHSCPILYSQVLVANGASKTVWPRRGIRDGESVGEYIFARRSWHDAEGMLLPITWLLPRPLISDFPFDPPVERHEDVDWLLRVTRDRNVAFTYIARPLAVWYADTDRWRASTRSDWRAWLAWGRERKALMTRRAYAGLLLQHVADRAVDAGERRALPGIAREAIIEGRTGPFEVLAFLRIALFRRGIRHRLATLLNSVKQRLHLSLEKVSG